MTTHNTGNPIGSTSLKDMQDNVENLDSAVNDRSSDTWIDRLGVPRLTWEGMTRLSNLGAAVEAAERAEAAAERAASYDNLQVYLSYDSPSDKRMVDDISQPVGTQGEVTNDADPDKNGWYTYSGPGGWVKNADQPVTDRTVRERLGAYGGAVSIRAVSEWEPLADKNDEGALDAADGAGNIIAGVTVTRNFQSRISELEGARGNAPSFTALPLVDKNDPGGVDFEDNVGNVLTGTTADLYLLSRINGGGGGGSGGGGSSESLANEVSLVGPVSVSGGDLVMGSDTIASLGSDGDFTAVDIQYPKAVIASTTMTAYEENTKVIAGGFTRNIVVPVDRKMALILFSNGQSLGAGAQSVPLLDFLLRSVFGDRLLMPGGEGMDVRFGSDASGAPPVPYDLTNFTSFQKLQSRARSTRGSTPIEGTATRLAHEMATQLAHVPVCVVSTAAWGGASLSTLRGVPWDNMEAGLQRIADLLAAQGMYGYCPGITWYHGQSNSSDANYQTGLDSFQSDSQDLISSIFGQERTTIPFLVRQPSAFNETEGTTDRTRAVRAMYNLSKLYPERFILTGTDQGLGRALDLTHLNATGSMHGGEGDALVMLRSLLTGDKKPPRCAPTSVSVAGTNVVVTFPDTMVIDTRLGEVPNLGATALSGDGSDASASITGVTVSGNIVTVAFSGGLPAAGSGRCIRFGLNSRRPPSGTDPSTLPRSNIRAAHVEYSIADGAPLFDWACHFSENF